MSEDYRPPTELFVKAQIRVAAQEGVPITVVHRGDPTSGTIILKINRLNGTARVMIEAQSEKGRIWTPATNTDPMSDAAAEAYLALQPNMDPYGFSKSRTKKVVSASPAASKTPRRVLPFNDKQEKSPTI